MGRALAEGLAGAGADVRTFDRTDKGDAASGFSVAFCHSLAELAEKSEVLFIAVKPKDVAAVAGELRGKCGGGKTLVSVCAGVSIAALESLFGEQCLIARTMPNLAAATGKSTTFVAFNEALSADAQRKARALAVLSCLGAVVEIPESQFAAATAISGSGIAFAFEFLSAFEDAAVRQGFSRAQSRQAALSVFEGAQAYVRHYDLDFHAARNRVVSPGGTTAEGLHVLARAGWGGVLSDALTACKNKAAAAESGIS